MRIATRIGIVIGGWIVLAVLNLIPGFFIPSLRPDAPFWSHIAMLIIGLAADAFTLAALWELSEAAFDESVRKKMAAILAILRQDT